MNKKVLVIVLALTLNIAIVSVAPVFAKNMHVSEGVEIAYGSGGEIRVVPPAGFPFPTSKLLIHVWDLDEATFGSGDSIILLIWMGSPTSGFWYPLAHFTTNLNSMGFFEDLWLGSPAGTKNTIYVPDDQLKVERHGNRITASITTQVLQKWIPTPPPSGAGHWDDVTIPAFTIELTKVGGSIHGEGGGDYLIYSVYGESTGFNATGVFTYGASTYTLNNECLVKMHMTYTFTPLSP
jgi:hypothetical protein